GLSPAEQPGAATDPTGDEDEIEQVVRAALDPATPIEARAEHFRSAPDGRPDVAEVLVGFDGLTASAGADLTAATFTIEHPAPGTALVDIDVPLDGSFGSNALLRGVLVRHGEDGWTISYESLCSLSGLAPILGGTDSCRAEPRLHRADHLPDTAELLDPDADAAQVTTRPIAAYDTSTSVRTGRWSWLVDYPEAEYGGGWPQTPAELVRVDAATGEETGRVRLPGTSPQLTVADDGLWAMSTPISPEGNWLHPVLTRIDPEQLTLHDGPALPIDTTTIAAAGTTLWTMGPNEVRRLRDGAVERTWSAGELGVDPTWGSTTPVATDVGLWLTGLQPADAVRRLPSDDGPIVLGPTDVAFLAPAGDGVWVRGATPDAALRRVDADGAVVATHDVIAAPAAVHQVWSDGDGGLWWSGAALGPGRDSTSTFAYDITARPVAVHLDAEGGVVDVWWATDTSPNSSSWFRRLGDGLGWVGRDGMQLVAS
ncbi:MAG: NHL repeat-containing protein, partial [Microthrixaceae bacterium]